jgi:hypothetical protein
MPRKVRPIRVCGGVAYVTLTQGYEAIIDAADVPLVDGWNWYAIVHKHTIYAMRSDYSGTKRRGVYLHRAIMGEPMGFQIDHIDGDGLKNKRCNLREATPTQNRCNQAIGSRNTSGFKGVSFHKRIRKWRAAISTNRKTKNLGYFSTPEEAHSAYCTASRELHGEFGRTL